VTVQRITKRAVDALQANGSEFTVWDDSVTGFGVRVRLSGAKSFVVIYRAGAGRGAPMRRYTIAAGAELHDPIYPAYRLISSHSDTLIRGSAGS
jgi:hypothetical protein